MIKRTLRKEILEVIYPENRDVKYVVPTLIVYWVERFQKKFIERSGETSIWLLIFLF